MIALGAVVQIDIHDVYAIDIRLRCSRTLLIFAGLRPKPCSFIDFCALQGATIVQNWLVHTFSEFPSTTGRTCENNKWQKQRGCQHIVVLQALRALRSSWDVQSTTMKEDFSGYMHPIPVPVSAPGGVCHSFKMQGTRIIGAANSRYAGNS